MEVDLIIITLSLCYIITISILGYTITTLYHHALPFAMLIGSNPNTTFHCLAYSMPAYSMPEECLELPLFLCPFFLLFPSFSKTSSSSSSSSPSQKNTFFQGTSPKY